MVAESRLSAGAQLVPMHRVHGAPGRNFPAEVPYQVLSGLKHSKQEGPGQCPFELREKNSDRVVRGLHRTKSVPRSSRQSNVDATDVEGMHMMDHGRQIRVVAWDREGGHDSVALGPLDKAEEAPARRQRMCGWKGSPWPRSRQAQRGGPRARATTVVGCAERNLFKRAHHRRPMA